MSGHGYSESLSEFSQTSSNLVIERNREVLESILNHDGKQQEMPKKRKLEDVEKDKEEKNFVAIDTFRFVQLHYHKMLYNENFMNQAKDGLKDSGSKSEPGRTEETLKNISNYMIKEAKNEARSTKYELELNLEDKPKFRGRFKWEIRKVEELIADLCGEKLEWKTPAIEPKYGFDIEDSSN